MASPPNRAVRLYKEYGEKTMDIVKNHPYKLCELVGVGFRTADKIAMSMGFDELSTERVDEALLYTLTDAESKGHLCLEKHDLLKSCLKILNTPQLTEDMLANRTVRLIQIGQMVSYSGNVYRSRTAYIEAHLAEMISRRLSQHKNFCYTDLDAELDKEEQILSVKLAPEQRLAVKTALTHGISIITGGPGTGKTMIQRALLDIYKRNHPGNEICCCAPTGRAARRMEQSTRFLASTVHKALGLLAGEDGNYNEPAELTADLILVDEVSMLDIYLAEHLFCAVKNNCQIVLIGDADQLPSVGPRAVLSEMIASECIPVVRLDKVFRQSAGSRIATNAKLIRHGNLSLEYGPDFQFMDSASTTESAEKVAEIYMQEIAKYGVDNVALLSPFRQRTETGVNALNELIRDLVNPPDNEKAEVKFGKRIFRCGDKVMQIKNHDDVNNGDIGYITKIINMDSETILYINFGDGKLKEYDAGDLDMLDLGYASTIHKSQGAEYQSVIINLQCAHAIMLTRPLIYTAGLFGGMPKGGMKVNHQQEHNDRLRGEFTVWLEVLIRNARTDYIRKVNRRVPTIALEDIPEHLLLDQGKYSALELNSNEHEGFDFEEERLATAFSKLPLMRQKILTLLFVEEKKPHEIAKQLHCSVQHVYNQRSLAIKKLRDLLCKGGDLFG